MQRQGKDRSSAGGGQAPAQGQAARQRGPCFLPVQDQVRSQFKLGKEPGFFKGGEVPAAQGGYFQDAGGGKLWLYPVLRPAA
jgi:hypothetical protein